MIAKALSSLTSIFSSVMRLILIAVVFAGPYLVYDIFPVQIYKISAFFAFLALSIAIVFLMIAIVPKARETSGAVILGASYPIGFSLWVWSVLLVGKAWGIGTLYCVNFFFGIGSILGALLATLLDGRWSFFGQLIMMVVIIMVLRVIGASLSLKSESSRKVSTTIQPDYASAAGRIDRI